MPDLFIITLFTNQNLLLNYQVPLEEGGGGGSTGAHFEKLVFGDEMMVSDTSTDAQLTVMSIAVGIDTGFYFADLSKGANYFWGKGEGCDMFNTNCLTANVDEFCSVQGRNSCSDNHLYKSSCSFSTFTSPCNINLHRWRCKRGEGSNAYHKFGHASMCLNTKVGFN